MYKVDFLTFNLTPAKLLLCCLTLKILRVLSGLCGEKRVRYG
jgi:hypothetical protein